MQQLDEVCDLFLFQYINPVKLQLKVFDVTKLYTCAILQLKKVIKSVYSNNYLKTKWQIKIVYRN
jgi:hypothetical protein